MALATAALLLAGRATGEDERARWAAEAARVEITRDDLGLAHVHGPTDADAVFGAIYAQAEDDFPRIEANYLEALGRTAEAQGEGSIWRDLRRRLFVDPDRLRAAYASSPPWLVHLMDAWADGLNAYLAAHPSVHPKVLTRFEPWMALAFTEGSIGGDDERVGLRGLEAFYGGPEPRESADEHVTASKGVVGSNGIAIAPSRSANGHALLLINPHTSFFFRSELQMTSDEGLDAFGAATWGQFFIYQGWNRHAGWMNTSTTVDNVDEFAETIERRDGRLFYRHGGETRPVRSKVVDLRFRRPDGSVGERSITTLYTDHGPLVRATGGKWIAVSMMDRPVAALEQSFLRSKVTDYASFEKVAALQANASNNTVFADDRGEIALLLPQFMPRRNSRFDYRRPVDGADPATDWKGPHALDELPRVVNPASGFVVNTNNGPWFSSGTDSPKASDYPRYFDTVGQNYRGVHALRLLDGARRFDLASLRDLAFDRALPAFDDLLPPLLAAHAALPADDPLRAKLAEPVAALRAWDRQWALESVPTTLACAWASVFWAALPGDASAAAKIDAIRSSSPREKLAALARAVDGLDRDFGSWRTPWGAVNRYQRPDGIAPAFDDARASLPVPFASGVLGSLAAFESRPYPGTRRWYGTKGNSFVAVVEFGPRVRALAVTTGGESGHSGDPHFSDQAAHYLEGDLEPIPFYPDEIAARSVRRYHPAT